MPTHKQKKPNKLGYSSSKRLKTMSDLDEVFSNSDDDPDHNLDHNLDLGAQLDTEWMYKTENNSNNKLGVGESNEKERKSEPQVDSIIIKTLKKQHGKLSSKQQED